MAMMFKHLLIGAALTVTVVPASAGPLSASAATLVVSQILMPPRREPAAPPMAGGMRREPMPMPGGAMGGGMPPRRGPMAPPPEMAPRPPLAPHEAGRIREPGRDPGFRPRRPGAMPPPDHGGRNVHRAPPDLPPGMVSRYDAARAAQRAVGGKLLDVQLSKRGAPVYRVRIRDRSQVREVTVDAVTGQVLGK